jgi:hypothetical protein
VFDGIVNLSNRSANGELGEHLTLVRAKSGHHLATQPRFYLFIVTTGVHYRLIRVDRALRPAEQSS